MSTCESLLSVAKIYVGVGQCAELN